MAEAIRIEGARELERALRASDKETAKGLRAELREAAKLVASDARARFQMVHPYSAMGMRPRVRSGFMASVEQGRKRTTGQHPEFGALQMRRALVPALESKRDEVEQAVERMLDRVADSQGF